MKTFIEYMNDSRPPRNEYEKAETEDLAKVFDEIGLEGDDIITLRARKHPTFLLRCHWDNHFEIHSLTRFPEIHGRVLDFGCGTGHLTTMLAERGLHIDGIDLSPVAIAVANHVASKSLTKNKPQFVCGDIAKLSVDPPYDNCWASHVFEHIKDPESVLGGIKKCLVPGGQILISVPLGMAYDDPDHVHHWATPDEFQAHFAPWLVCTNGEVDQSSHCIRGVFKFK